MATIVLISGAWHGAWCWERVVPLLEEQGHRVLAPDLLGMGEDPTPLGAVSLAAWADQIAGIVSAQAEPVILVGHSRGGVVISEVGERVPEGIAALVYLTAVMLPDGESIAGDSGAALQAASGGIIDFHPDGTSTLNPAAVSQKFYNLTPQEWTDRAARLLGPEPMTAFTTHLHLTPDRYGSLPRYYIETVGGDLTMPLERQRQMQARLPCKMVLGIESDHSPFYSRPTELADALSLIARDVTA